LNYIHLGADGASLLVTDIGVPMTLTNQVDTGGVDLSLNLSSYYMTGANQKYLIVGEKSHKGNFSLIAMIPNREILKNLPYLNRIVFVISFLCVLLVPGFLLFLRKSVVIPLRRIVSVMKRIGEGNVKFRIDPHPTSDEFQLVNTTFNKMMAQIEELKINVYEEQLNKQKAELQHLQLQINPHFFMNTLSIIYNLALTKNYENIQDMSLRLVRYFRFMFRSNLTFVPLQEELDHVLNYVRIQELRFQQALTCHIEKPETLDKFPVHIPPLIIQTFVENAMKYAVSLDNPLIINILDRFGEYEWQSLY